MEVINGFQCKDCTDIDYAKKHIDPAHPKDGPYGVNADTNPENALRRPAFVLDGAATGLYEASDATRQPYAAGGNVSLTA